MAGIGFRASIFCYYLGTMRSTCRELAHFCWQRRIRLGNPARLVFLALAMLGNPTLAQDAKTREPRDPVAKEGKELPEFTNELAKKAAIAISAGDWKTAKTAYVELLKDEPDNPLVLSNLGAVEYELGELEAASGHMERAVQLRPTLAATWTTLALIYYGQKDYHLALSAISRVVHEKPKDAYARNYLAVIIKALGYANGAEAELQRAITFDPNYAEAHFNLALMYLERKPPAAELASRHYAKARALGAKYDILVENQLAELRAAGELPQEGEQE